jgi:hypothetical protein
MSVSVMDAPNAPMLATDTLQNIPGGFDLPTYRIHSFELLAAVLAQALRIAEPIVIFDFLLAPIFALLSICSAAYCLRTLLPRDWGWACLVLVALLMVWRESRGMYGKFAFVSMYQGKSVLLTMMIPMIVAYAVEFSARPRLGGWVLLALAQVSAVGLSANGLYLGPLAAGLALAASWRPTWKATRLLGVGLLASIHPVVVGLLTRFTMQEQRLTVAAYREPWPIETGIQVVLGAGPTLVLSLGFFTWCGADRTIRQWTWLLLCFSCCSDGSAAG